MPVVALLMAIAALACAALRFPGVYVGLCVATMSGAIAWVVWRDRRRSGAQRLIAASALALTSAALVLLALRVAVMLTLFRHIGSLV